MKEIAPQSTMETIVKPKVYHYLLKLGHIRAKKDDNVTSSNASSNRTDERWQRMRVEVAAKYRLLI